MSAANSQSAKPTNTRPGLKLVHRFPPGVRIVSAMIWKDAMFIATTRGIYAMATKRSKVREVKWKA